MLRSLVKSIPPAETNVILAGPTLAAGTYGGARDGGAPRTAQARTATEPDAEQTAAAATPGGSPPRTARPGGDKSRPRLRLKKGVSMKDDLTEIVREDPDAAAAIIRSWIGNAG
jgi:flagellar biosynthesis/type III secretory pathway M-ring protein FliF/YscJ